MIFNFQVYIPSCYSLARFFTYNSMFILFERKPCVCILVVIISINVKQMIVSHCQWGIFFDAGPALGVHWVFAGPINDVFMLIAVLRYYRR